MKYKICFFYISAILLFFCFEAKASWLIDPERFHTSFHGRTSCIECHDSIKGEKLHPDPAYVNKNIYDFFTADKCAGCHETVDDYLSAGVHGGKKIEKKEEIENCISCHDPHYQTSSSVKAKKYNPLVPVKLQCAVCHEKKENLPDFSKEDFSCISCHKIVDPTLSGSVKHVIGFCFYCHSSNKDFKTQIVMPLIDKKSYEKSAHSNYSCLACHPYSAQFGHLDKPHTDCRNCHFPHDEKVAHDAHTNVSCEACHLKGIVPEKNKKTNRIEWDIGSITGGLSQIHDMAISDENESCERCHYKGNSIGAASMALPAKSIICMPCHASTFSVEDRITVFSLIGFISGLFYLVSIFLSGQFGEKQYTSSVKKFFDIILTILRIVFSFNIIIIIRSLIADVLFQKRFYKADFSRWAIHALIFYPFVIRFFWGTAALALSLFSPELSITNAMLNKNYPLTAFLFDITGIMVLIGVILSIILKQQRPSAKFESIPGQDWLAVSLLGSIVLVGFALEAMRIQMTGGSEGAIYAFLGYALNRLLIGMTDINNIYGYIWYVHAALTGLFLIYLPFSRMLHIIISPIVLIMKRIKDERK